jgi:hypothetical protein
MAEVMSSSLVGSTSEIPCFAGKMYKVKEGPALYAEPLTAEARFPTALLLGSSVNKGIKRGPGLL